MAEEKKVEKTRKNNIFKYELMSHVIVMTTPSNREVRFNISNHTNGMSLTNELTFQYGVRQWLMSSQARLYQAGQPKPTEDEIVTFLRSEFKAWDEEGLELSEGGTKISIKGRERANSSEAGATRKLQKEVASTAVSMVDLTQKLLAGTITPEETAKLQELMAAAKTLGEKVKK